MIRAAEGSAGNVWGTKYEYRGNERREVVVLGGWMMVPGV